MNGNPKRKLITRILLRILTVLSVLAAMVVFYLTVILSMPDDNAPLTAQDTPAPILTRTGAPAFIDSESDIPTLAAAFPAPLMRLLPTQDITFSTGRAYDTAFEGAFAREAELVYVMDDGTQLSLRSVYPRHAFALLEKQGYSLSYLTGYTFMNLPAVRMDSDGWIRFHAQGSDALYILSLPRQSAVPPEAFMRLIMPELPLS